MTKNDKMRELKRQAQKDGLYLLEPLPAVADNTGVIVTTAAMLGVKIAA